MSRERLDGLLVLEHDRNDQPLQVVWGIPKGQRSPAVGRGSGGHGGASDVAVRKPEAAADGTAAVGCSRL